MDSWALSRAIQDQELLVLSSFERKALEGQSASYGFFRFVLLFSILQILHMLI